MCKPVSGGPQGLEGVGLGWGRAANADSDTTGGAWDPGARRQAEVEATCGRWELWEGETDLEQREGG